MATPIGTAWFLYPPPNSMRCSPLLQISLAALALTGCSSSNSDPATTASPGAMALSLGVDPIYLTGEQGIYALVMHEGSSNGDLNADGDLDDLVLHTLSLSTNEVRNHGLALATPPPTALLPLDSRPKPTIRAGQIFFYVSEAGQGQTDFNGDGDALDSVAMQLDTSSGSVFNLSQTGISTFDVDSFEVIDDQLLYLSEGPPSTSMPTVFPDLEVQVYDLQTRTPRDLDLVVSNASYPLFRLIKGNEGVAILGVERGLDLNGDGDQYDSVLHYYDAAKKELSNSRIATGANFANIDGSLWATVVDEFGEAGMDLNGDGDIRDQVVHIVDFEDGSRVNLGVAVDGAILATPKSLLFLVSEAAQGLDLNADGDLFDDVVHAYDLGIQRLTNTGLASLPFHLKVAGQLGAFSVSEFGSPGMDLNGDGDIFDDVLFTIDLDTQRTTNHGLVAHELVFGNSQILVRSSPPIAIPLGSNSTPPLQDFTNVFDPRSGDHQGPFFGTTYETKGRYALLRVSEFLAQEDLNDDGDRLDFVSSVLDLSSLEARSLRLDGDAELTAAFGVLIFLFESKEGEDLNGDGDLEDRVLHRAQLPFPLPTL